MLFIDINSNWRTITEIINLDSKKLYTATELALLLDLKPTNPRYQKILCYLKEKNYIKVIRKIGTAQQIKIYPKKIAEHLRKAKDFEYTTQIIKMTTSLYNI